MNDIHPWWFWILEKNPVTFTILFLVGAEIGKAIHTAMKSSKGDK